MVGECLFALDHCCDTFFERSQTDETVDLHLPCLAYAVGAVRRLILDRGVPPAIVMKDMICRGEVQGSTPCVGF